MRQAFKSLSFYVFSLGQRFGLNILPNHYYTQISDIHYLRRTKDIWARQSAMPGCSMDLSSQVSSLESMVLPYEREYRGNRIYEAGVAGGFGPGFGYVEAQALHGVVRHISPRRIVEVGSGVSTHCMLEALRQNDVDCSVTCIEPNPSGFLKSAPVQLLQKPVQECDYEVFLDLQDGDLLFIDSSHSTAVASDVIYLFLEIVPRLKPGVFVHVHDINFPYHYRRDILKTYIQSGESALLQALLVGNSKLSVVFCLSYLHYLAPANLRKVFPEYRPQSDDSGLVDEGLAPFSAPDGHFPSSIFLRVNG